MQNADLSQVTSQDQGSRIPDTPPQPSAEPGVAPASTIERAAQRLDWTIAFGMRHNAPRDLEETTNQQPRRDPPDVTRASPVGSSRARGSRLRLISRICLASALAAAAAGTGMFLLTHSGSEKATAESAPGTDVTEKANETVSLIRGLALLPAAGTTQSVTLAGPAPRPATPELEAKLIPEPSPSPLGEPKPNVATTPAAKTSQTTSTFASPAPGNHPTVPAFSAADIAELLARGDWLFATGDAASARLLYERAAAAGEPRAAVRLGETFDPVYLDYTHLRGSHGDPSTAVFWYRRARDLGATGIAGRLKRLEANEGRN